jgi:hypothetical protein
MGVTTNHTLRCLPSSHDHNSHLVCMCSQDPFLELKRLPLGEDHPTHKNDKPLRTRVIKDVRAVLGPHPSHAFHSQILAYTNLYIASATILLPLCVLRPDRPCRGWSASNSRSGRRMQHTSPHIRG